MVHRHGSKGSCGPQSRLAVSLNSGRSQERKYMAVWQTCGHSRSRGQCKQRPGDVEERGEPQEWPGEFTARRSWG